MQNDNRNDNRNGQDNGKRNGDSIDRGNRNRNPPRQTTDAMKIAYVITRRGDKDHWSRIGVAFVNSDGSINVKLESLPISGEIHIRDYVPREDGGR